VSNLSKPPLKEDNFSPSFQRWLAKVHELLAPVSSTGLILWTSISKVGSSLTDLATRNHADLQNINTATYTHLSATNATDLTDGGDSTLHYHASDRTYADNAITTHAGQADPHTGYQKESQLDAASGYAGLNSASRITKGVDTTDDVIIDSNTKGIVLKDNAGTPHYWRINVSTLGVLTTTDLGTTKP
jgi:hypothetical protein